MHRNANTYPTMISLRKKLGILYYVFRWNASATSLFIPNQRHLAKIASPFSTAAVRRVYLAAAWRRGGVAAWRCGDVAVTAARRTSPRGSPESPIINSIRK